MLIVAHPHCSGRERADNVRRLFDELGVANDARERIFVGTACAWLGIAR
jgi:hypothetical protein